jgi:hypothetical protein
VELVDGEALKTVEDVIEDYLNGILIPNEVIIRLETSEGYAITTYIDVHLDSNSVLSIDSIKYFIDGIVFVFRWKSVFKEDKS